ncbi:hypothetical protein ABB37_01332 [Leptomonas pyrrhocoris]|uniref:Uncharacterized protein n=1 Tax=Leptomonas pyrrhocoris TaxID=157538 RepID=A0A0M9G8U7_LEPPY|nr:hypothetical protein ABB37_01332 [Leptomonas pyrrhocoris]KPA84869.1 hypothetical protein ABB37_01332 [Leptomonas pyrrhocoris]|eukprot:XP_015663308.1 hypothetical protein ABB37_01332 [Leptomonas pyrrhocoris]
MSSLFISLVDRLATRHEGGRRHNAAPDAEEQALRLFLVSCDLIGAFQPADLCAHLAHMMSVQWPETLRSEGSSRSSALRAASASLPASSIPTLVAASGALIGFLWAHKAALQDTIVTQGPTTAAPASRAWVDEVHDQWQSYVLQLLMAHPPFSAETCTVACCTVGQLSLLPEGCCDRVLRAACEALRAGREDGLTAVLATELLGQCVSLMVVCRPFQLRGAVLVDPALQHKCAQENNKRKQKSADASNSQANRRTRSPTQRPATGEKNTEASVAVKDACDGNAATAAAEASSCSALPSCYPFPPIERVTQLKAELIECCLATLGAFMATSTEATTLQHCTVPTALICQRVLIPLLLLDGNEGLQRYEELIHSLLYTLATAATPFPVQDGAGVAVSNVTYGDNCDDVVLLISVLFDFLFRRPSLEPATDFRYSPFLWGVLSSAMHRSLTAAEMDAGHRANMQLRVEYLLKRIVYLTKEQQYQHATTTAPLPAMVEFHPLFFWCSSPLSPSTGEAPSATAWDNFFLVLESLNEYGWHIIEPVMARLDTLVAALNSHLECSARAAPCTQAAKPSTQGALHTRWIEMLLLKLVLHPNIGVRKVGLRRVWGLPQRVLQSLSAAFLFQDAFQSASDPRLCADLDRIPISASFLDTKAFEGTEVKAVPDIEPLAQEVERFYSALFLTRWHKDGAGADADAVSTSGRIDALHRLLDTTLNKPPRFTVCVLARTLLAMGQVLFDHHIDAEPILLDEGVLQRLHRFMRDSVQENVPFWLDVRVTAILFAALTTFVAATASPRRCRQHPSFWRLYCMCGPLGESGGHSITGMDASGQYGLVGASVDERFLQQWLVQLSAQMLDKRRRPVPEGEHDSSCFSFVDELLDADGLEGRVKRLLQTASSTPSVAAVNVVEVKEAFFLIGALTRTGSVRDTQLIRCTAHTIASTVASLQTRAYCTPAQLLSSAACLVELQHTLGSEVCGQLWPLRTTLQSMSAALHTHVMASLSAAVHAVSVGPSNAAAGGTSLFVDGADELVWTVMHTAHFDILAAATASVNSIACSSGDAASSTQDASSVAAAARYLDVSLHVEQLMSLLKEAVETYKALISARKHDNEAADEERVAAVLVITRNIYRLLQSELCGFLAVSNNAVDTARQHDGHPPLHPSSLPADRESPTASHGGVARCPLAGVLSSQAVQSYLQQLMFLLTYRVPTGPMPSALSPLSWSTLLGQHGRYRNNLLYVLALCLGPVSAQDTRSSEGCTTSQADFESIVAALQSFALGQLEECWTMNLASVYDLLVWVASSNVPRVVDYIAIADGMWGHMKEVGARQYTRLAALAFTVLHFVMPHHPEYVRALLLRVLEGEGKEAQTADRDVYFAAMTASLQVLHNPAQNWPVLSDALLYAAVLFNTNRDEEENESTVAVTEPLLRSWPDALRLYYPPTTRLSAVGRAMAVATLLWCCHVDVAGRAVPLTVELLRMNVCHPVVTHEPCMPNSRTHRTRIRLWQLLCALLPCLAQPQQPVPLPQIEEVFRLLVSHCVTVNNMGSVRRLMELYAIRLVEQHPGLYTVVSEVLGNYSLRPQVCGSYILIACHALLRQEDRAPRKDATAAAAAVDEVAAGTFDSLFPRILQQSTSNQHLLRIISHIGLVNICQRRIAHGRPLSAAVEAVYNYVLHAPEHIKFREKHEHMLFFDTDVASSPRSLFCVQRKEANTVLAEVLPAAAFERIRFVETELCCVIGALYPMELLRVRDLCATLRVGDLVSVFKDFAAIPHTTTPCDYYVDYTQEATELLTRDPMAEAGPGGAAAAAVAGSAGEEVDAATANVQKKVSSWWTSEVYNELHPRALRKQKQSIIVVGSLVENPVNIAGLCRCGEIFAVESIVVPEKKVFEHPHFVAAARSAELWIPWEEVMPKDLPGYLEGLRRRGYVIVGIEQTANSVSMEAFSFPARCAVVLGAEGQGVPAPLIPLLDVCVEIPQYGLIRSLNVHVTGAIAMYEYTRQHLMGKTRE